MRLEHLGLAARDPIALADWYQHVFQAQILFRNDQSPPAFLLELWGSRLEIYPCGQALPGRENNLSQGWRHLALLTDSIESARKALEDRGVVFTDPIKPAGGGGRVLFFRDLEDNLLHLVQRDGGLK